MCGNERKGAFWPRCPIFKLFIYYVILQDRTKEAIAYAYITIPYCTRAAMLHTLVQAAVQ
jgi:hypothetical protein